MSIFGQPDNYPQMLQRIFSSTLVVGVGCTMTLGWASPALRALLQSVDLKVDLGPVKELQLLYVLLPFAVAIISRVVKLHDRISDALGLRETIDTEWILLPLAVGVGLEVDEAMALALRLGRRKALYAVFYPYVSLPDSKIDRQLVRTALDNLGWLWVMVEAFVLVLVTLLGLVLLGSSTFALMISAAAVALGLSIGAQWRACRRSTSDQVSAILADGSRHAAIRAYFDSI